MKKLFFAIAALTVFAACSTNEEAVTPDTKEYVASIGATLDETRTHLDGFNVVWDEGDVVTIFNATETVEYYASVAGTASTTLLPKGSVGITANAGPYYAVYGPNANATVKPVETSFTATVTLPSTHVYDTKNLNSYGKGANVMVAEVSNLTKENNKLTFKNLTSMLKIGVKTKVGKYPVESLTFRTGSGNITGTFTTTDAATVTGGDGKVITLSGISATISTEVTYFYIAVPNNVTITDPSVELTVNVDGTPKIFGKKAKATLEVAANQIYTISGEAGLEFAVAPLMTYAIGDTYSDKSGVTGTVYELTGNVVDGKSTSGMIYQIVTGENYEDVAGKIATPWRMANSDDWDSLVDVPKAGWSGKYWTGTLTGNGGGTGSLTIYTFVEVNDGVTSSFTISNEETENAVKVQSFVNTDNYDVVEE